MMCPKCNSKLEMRYTPSADKKEVMTFGGLKEWSFKGFHSCKHCRCVVEDTEQMELAYILHDIKVRVTNETDADKLSIDKWLGKCPFNVEHHSLRIMRESVSQDDKRRKIQ